jgi:uncharacterized membrane protein
MVCWAAWALLSKLGSYEIPAKASQFVFTWGLLPLALVLLAGRRFKLEKNAKGIFYGLGNGVLATIGGWAVFAAFRMGGNTSVIVVVTAMYPLITVMLALLVLRERLTIAHIIGLVFAAAAFVIFSL